MKQMSYEQACFLTMNVAGETFVYESILMEDEGFLNLLKGNADYDTLVEYAEENF